MSDFASLYTNGNYEEKVFKVISTVTGHEEDELAAARVRNTAEGDRPDWYSPLKPAEEERGGPC